MRALLPPVTIAGQRCELSCDLRSVLKQGRQKLIYLPWNCFWSGQQALSDQRFIATGLCMSTMTFIYNKITIEVTERRLETRGNRRSAESELNPGNGLQVP